MTTNHTSGPWQLGDTRITVSTDGFDAYAIPISGSGSAIGCVYAGAVGRPRSVEVEYANARLIASAPDLLVVLEKALAAPVDQFSNVAQYKAWLDLIARAAILRAKGE